MGWELIRVARGIKEELRNSKGEYWDDNESRGMEELVREFQNVIDLAIAKKQEN